MSGKNPTHKRKEAVSSTLKTGHGAFRHVHSGPSRAADMRGPVSFADFINPPGEGPNPDWTELGQRSIQESLHSVRRMAELDHQAKNVIFFMGDGMGVNTISAARIYLAQTRGIVGEDAILSFEKFPFTAFARTYATDILTSDSANTATAMMCGEKTGETIICANQHVIQNNCTSLHDNHLKSVLHHAIDNGMWTGVVTNTRITHASPAVNFAHAGHRNWESDADLPEGVDCTDIAAQLIDEEINKNIRVILGGGRYAFLPNGTFDPEYPGDINNAGKRLDGRNLIEEWLAEKREAGMSEDEFAFVHDQEEFNDVNEERIQYLMGLFEPGHMRYEMERENEPSLVEMVERSIKVLERSSKGYFLFVENGLIDTGHHANMAQKALNETASLSDAVAKAIELTNEDDTLIIVSADHSHVFSLAGYASRDSDILGWDNGYLANPLGDDDKPYTILQYANGPGFYDHRTRDGSLETEQPRLELTREMTGGPDFRYDAGIPLQSETHGGEDVAIYARGPMSHLFHGIQEQNYIAHVINYALCIGENQGLCDDPPPPIAECPTV